MASILGLAEKRGIQINACGFSVKQLNVNSNDIPKQVKIIENGMHYTFQLQKKGYASLEM